MTTYTTNVCITPVRKGFRGSEESQAITIFMLKFTYIIQSTYAITIIIT